MEIAVYALSAVTGIGALILSLVNFLSNRANQKAATQLQELGLAMGGLRDLAAERLDEIKDLREQLGKRDHHASA